jgi:signal transduction histidine kinase
MPVSIHFHLLQKWICFIGTILILLKSASPSESQDYPSLTSIGAIPSAALTVPPVNFQIRLEADVWWADPAANQLVLHDATGSCEVELDLQGQPLGSGQRIRIEGNGALAKTANGFRLGVIGPVVDNDGVHSMIEKSGLVYLPAGPQPLRLDWFNGTYEYGLKVGYAGPGVPRREIPGSALFHLESKDGTSTRMAGLNYSTYDVTGESLPDFRTLPAINSGTVTGFDLSILPHKEHVGVEFNGFLDVPRAGVYTFDTTSDDGSELFVGGPSMLVTVIGHCVRPEPQPLELGRTVTGDEDFQWVQVEGTIDFVNKQDHGLKLDLSSGSGRISLDIPDRRGLSPELVIGRRLRAIGVCQNALTTDGLRIANKLLVPGAKEIELIPSEPPPVAGEGTNGSALPILTTAAEIHQLKREEAQRGYPVALRGVVTCVLPEHQAFTIQDATRGIYVVDLSQGRSFLPQLGEFLEISGTSDAGLFAPVVNAHTLRSLGAGRLPDPVRPTWDQLLNGSLDAQYVELEGIIAAVNTTNVVLLTRDGRINLELRVTGLRLKSLSRYEDALLRVRGCLLANWDYVTHQVTVGNIRIYDADLAVDRPAPPDLFAIPEKSVADLLLFDPEASGLQRVKVSGQIVHCQEVEGYLTDGRNALRFITKRPMDLQAGDLAEVVGFPELSGAAPILREALVRETGHASLPPAKALSAKDLASADNDASRVRISGVLVSVRESFPEEILEVQNGVRTFAARLNNTNGFAGSLILGSRLELTGVYSSLGANKAAGQDISGFELLLNSPGDVQVLARPPWWTLERMLVIVGVLAGVLAITVLWINQLHRKVESRTAELEIQIKERQRVVQQRVMEQERARVAQDLHDELGSSLTEISMLGARARSAAANEMKREELLGQMSNKASEMVTALDEIVWAMNPQHDSLASLVSYFCLYADRFLGLANIPWRLEGGTVPEDLVVDSRLRHQLFLAFKEALNNVVRHSGASQVRLGIQLEAGELQLSIADNGRGLASTLRAEDMDGVANMRARMEKLGGRFEIGSDAGQGTTLRFRVTVR